MKYDFGGYATKHNIRCSDGRTIMPDAFKECDGQIVPLVWQHVHDSPDNVLGHAQLENRSDGVYAYCSLNDTTAGETARKIVKHGDICALSIYANRLQQQGQNVMHGVIREVSLVLAGANPGATIDNLSFMHSDGYEEVVDDEAQIYYVEPDSIISLQHADDDPDEKEDAKKEDVKDDSSEESNETIEEIIDTMNDKQKAALYAIVGALSEDEDMAKEEDKSQKAGKKSDDEEISHADFDDDATVEEILNSLDDDQQAAVNAVIEALANDDDDVPDDVKNTMKTLSKDQMDAVYALVGILFDEDDEDDEDEGKEMKHADGESDETIQDVMDTLSEEQQGAVNQILDAVLGGKGSVPKSASDLFNTLDDKQKDAVYALVGLALEENQNGGEEDDQTAEHSDFEGEEMKYNVFDAETGDEMALAHADVEAIFDDAPRYGSLKDTVLAHGITDIEVLFPEAQAVNNQPYSLARRMEWVSVVLNGVHKSPFARIKSTAANLTEDQARAKGYVKGRKKIEEQISALRRVTTPQTIYKTQKLDRDDVVDITDFDVVAWMKQEMRMMLDEELARAILIGDGRRNADPAKIFEDHVRSIWNDDEMYTIHKTIATANANDFQAFMDECVRARLDYKGSGTPTMFIDPVILTEMRLLKDQDGRYRYESDQKLADAMRVSKIVEVEVMHNAVRTVEGKDHKAGAIIVNLADYTVGANKGGEVSLFDDFDLDFNKYEYLIETRVSGALTMPKSAMAIEFITTKDSEADPVYVIVANPVTADIDDYYEMDEYGRLSKTVDAAVVAGKKYYTVAE